MNLYEDPVFGKTPSFRKRFGLLAAGFQDSLVDKIDHYRLNGDVNQAAAIALYAILSFLRRADRFL